jgi:hypothetical protein
MFNRKAPGSIRSIHGQQEILMFNRRACVQQEALMLHREVPSSTGRLPHVQQEGMMFNR